MVDGHAAIEVIDEKRSELAKQTEQVDNALGRVRSFEVASHDDAKKAGQWLTAAKARAKYLKGWSDEVVGPIYRTYKNARAEFSRPEKKYAELIQLLNRKIADWDRHLREEARKQEAELRRIQEAEAAERKRDLEAQAKEASDKGDQELAAEKLSQAEFSFVPVVVVPQVPLEHEGLSRRKTWKARVVDRAAFVAAILDGTIRAEYAKIEPHTSMLNALARSSEGRAKMPGVSFEEDITFAEKP